MILRFTALADDELILAQRNGEWIGHAPILEEDIALANLAQDELGHAETWLRLRAELDGSDPDALAFGRDATEFRCAQLLEYPRGDWAFTLLRQFLFDAYESVWLSAARASSYRPLREAAEKMLREERFHLQHSALWIQRLGLGTDESRRRTQAALELQWPLSAQLFVPLPGEAELAAQGLLPDLSALRPRWEESTRQHLGACGLSVPAWGAPEDVWSRDQHSPHLPELLAEMQGVARADPEAVAW
nr:1,2-phenylacetyl-CoA epoxidase subunit PaaC [Deinobacterium chartae]